MSRLIYADAYRMFRSKWFWLSLGGMLVMSVGMVTMQYTAMDYTVPLSRVIFLPLSLYGVTMAAMISLFIGEDFSDGFVRNKLIAGRSRLSVFMSNMIITCLADIMIYFVTIIFTVVVGSRLFENDVTPVHFSIYLLFGIGMCLAYSCIFSVITMLCGNKTIAAVACMGLSFLMLFLCMRTNQIMVQPEFKEGVLNPHYVDGIAKTIYALIHDLNPTGQAVQLSTMNIWNPIRWILCDIFWVTVAGISSLLFNKADIK